MFYVFNIIVIALVAFIAYWWANQGLFSALLHLLCVVVAGAVAIAVWEPLALALLVKGSSGFSNYGWGLTLLISFALVLFLLRLAMDKLAPRNVRLPNWANLAFGIPVAAAAGVLTMGMFVIGAGFIQCSDDLLGYKGYTRGPRSGQMTRVNKLWIPVDQLTAQFYSWMSVTSMKTAQPLRHYNPDLDKQASMIRGFYKNKMTVGAIAIGPDSFRVGGAIFCPDNNRYAVKLHFDSAAKDFGDQLTLSRSQLRLIGTASGTAKAPFSSPDHWTQDVAPGDDPSGIKHYTFVEDATAYITSVAGRETLDVTVQFPAPSTPARFIQIRNIRKPVTARSVDLAEWESIAGSIEDFDELAGVDPGDFAPQSIQRAISIQNRIRGLNVGTNRLPGGIKVNNDRYLTTGYASFSKSGERAPTGLAVQGIAEAPGTKIILLDVSPGSPASVFGPAARLAGENDQLALVDAAGRKYSPIGYIHRTDDAIDIKLSPGRYMRVIDDFPPLPRVSNQTLEMVFSVTVGVTITEFQWGTLNIGHCNLQIRDT